MSGKKIFIYLSDTVDQDLTVRSVQSDLDLHSQQRVPELHLAAKGLEPLTQGSNHENKYLINTSLVNCLQQQLKCLK